MTLAQVNEILLGTFADENDRKYWEDKRAEIIRKEYNAAENAEYYKENRKYDR